MQHDPMDRTSSAWHLLYFSIPAAVCDDLQLLLRIRQFCRQMPPQFRPAAIRAQRCKHLNIGIGIYPCTVLFTHFRTDRECQLFPIDGKLCTHAFFIPSCIKADPRLSFFQIDCIQSMDDQLRVRFVIQDQFLITKSCRDPFISQQCRQQMGFCKTDPMSFFQHLRGIASDFLCINICRMGDPVSDIFIGFPDIIQVILLS